MEIVSSLPTLEHVVHVPYLHALPPPVAVDTLTWAECCATSGPLEFVAVPFEHALYVLFSSGTTGLPKPIVNGWSSASSASMTAALVKATAWVSASC